MCVCALPFRATEKILERQRERERERAGRRERKTGGEGGGEMCDRGGRGDDSEGR